MRRGSWLLDRSRTLPGYHVLANCTTLVGQPPEFRITFDHKGQLVRALENVPPCLLELSRRAEDVKRGVAQAKTTTLSAHSRGLHQVAREIVALVDNNVG
jgi:hypothetical protein